MLYILVSQTHLYLLEGNFCWVEKKHTLALTCCFKIFPWTGWVLSNCKVLVWTFQFWLVAQEIFKHCEKQMTHLILPVAWECFRLCVLYKIYSLCNLYITFCLNVFASVTLVKYSNLVYWFSIFKSSGLLWALVLKILKMVHGIKVTVIFEMPSFVWFQIKEIKGSLDANIHFWLGSETTQVWFTSYQSLFYLRLCQANSLMISDPP